MQSNFDRFLAHVGCYGQTTKRAMDVTMCRAPHRLYLGNQHSARWVAKKIQLKPTARKKTLKKWCFWENMFFWLFRDVGLLSGANMLLVSGSVTWKKFLGGNQILMGISVEKSRLFFQIWKKLESLGPPVERNPWKSFGDHGGVSASSRSRYHLSHQPVSG